MAGFRASALTQQWEADLDEGEVLLIKNSTGERLDDDEVDFLFNWFRSMSHVNLFNKIDDRVLKRLCRTVTVQKFSAGETVFEQSSYGYEFFITLRGTVSIEAAEEQDGEIISEPRTIDVLMPGAGFGELALISGRGLRTASVRCREDCTFLIITKKDYDRFVKQAHEDGQLQVIALRVFEQVDTNLSGTVDRTELLAFLQSIDEDFAPQDLQDLYEAIGFDDGRDQLSFDVFLEAFRMYLQPSAERFSRLRNELFEQFGDEDDEVGPLAGSSALSGVDTFASEVLEADDTLRALEPEEYDALGKSKLVELLVARDQRIGELGTSNGLGSGSYRPHHARSASKMRLDSLAAQAAADEQQELYARIDETEDRNRRLEKKLREAQQSLMREMTNRVALLKETSKLTKTKDKHDDELRLVQEQLEESNASRQMLRDLLDKVEADRDKLLEQMDKAQEVAGQAASQTDLVRQNTELRGQVAEFEEESQELADQVQELDAALATATSEREGFEEEVQSLKAIVRSLQKARRSLGADLSPAGRHGVPSIGGKGRKSPLLGALDIDDSMTGEPRSRPQSPSLADQLSSRVSPASPRLVRNESATLFDELQTDKPRRGSISLLLDRRSSAVRSPTGSSLAGGGFTAPPSGRSSLATSPMAAAGTTTLSPPQAVTQAERQRFDADKSAFEQKQAADQAELARKIADVDGRDSKLKALEAGVERRARLAELIMRTKERAMHQNVATFASTVWNDFVAWKKVGAVDLNVLELLDKGRIDPEKADAFRKSREPDPEGYISPYIIT